MTEFAAVGPPADYVAYFGVNGEVTYPYKSVYLEYQSWLTDNTVAGAAPGHHSEHIHMGACIPEAQTLNDTNAKPWRLDTKIIFHNLAHYKVTQTGASIYSYPGGSVRGFVATQAELDELDAAAQASSGLNTITVFQPHVMGIPGVDKDSNTPNGLKELRWQLTVERDAPEALVDRWVMNGRAYFNYNYAGRASTPPGPDDCHVYFVRTQSWIFWTENGVAKNGYGYAGFGDSRMNLEGACTYPAAWNPDGLDQVRPDNWTTVPRTTDGPNRLFAYVDPNFHAHPDTNAWSQDLGNPATTGVVASQGYDNAVNVPLGALSLTPGIHRFMVQGHKWPGAPGIQPINTMIAVMPIRIGGADTVPPTVPTALRISNIQPSSVTLGWNASTDAVGVKGYRVYRNGVQVADVPGLSASVGNLSQANHLLEVEAYDAAGNRSTRAKLTITRTWK